MARKVVFASEFWKHEAPPPRSAFDVDPVVLIGNAERKVPPVAYVWERCAECGRLRPHPRGEPAPARCVFCERGTRFMGDSVVGPGGVWKDGEDDLR